MAQPKHSSAQMPSSKANRKFGNFDTSYKVNTMIDLRGGVSMVRNCEKTKDDKTGASWIAHYKKFAPREAYDDSGTLGCAVLHCTDAGKNGGHVLLHNHTALYIVPLCTLHNNYTRNDYYACSCTFALKLYNAISDSG